MSNNESMIDVQSSSKVLFEKWEKLNDTLYNEESVERKCTMDAESIRACWWKIAAPLTRGQLF